MSKPFNTTFVIEPNSKIHFVTIKYATINYNLQINWKSLGRKEYGLGEMTSVLNDRISNW